MQVPICPICREAVWTFICPDCLASDISKWLPKRLSRDFLTFSNGLVRHFSSFLGGDRLSCLHCNTPREVSICTFCYIKEVSEWLGERNAKLGKSLGTLLSMAKITKFQPAMKMEESAVDEGICESCGMFSSTLTHRNGKWICEECEDFDG